jgi:hypothetical protein
MLRNRIGVWNDPLFHLVAVVAIVVGATLALDRRGPGSPAKVKHPANCHACSKCSPDVVAARDRFLLRAGAIEDIGLPE